MEQKNRIYSNFHLFEKKNDALLYIIISENWN